MTRFSICIPNFNYADYIGETIASVLAADGHDLEILVADNASTDDSLAVIAAFDDGRIRVTVNPTNVGFAGNLDRAAAGASGDVMIMLSSDDVMAGGALDVYRTIFEKSGTDRIVVSSAETVIDSAGIETGSYRWDDALWAGARNDRSLSRLTGVPVLEIDPDVLLRRCLGSFRNPFNFASTAYPRSLYDEVGGYGGGRLFNPDKWFHWRLIGRADRVLFVDSPLVSYRWHAANQASIETGTGVLKFLVDDYVSSFEVSDDLLAVAGLDRGDLARAFVEYDIARHGLATLARGHVTRARRTAHFGRATYPLEVRHNPKAWLLRALLVLGPLGARLASAAYARADTRPDPFAGTGR